MFGQLLFWDAGTQEWKQATSIAKAFNIGQREADAVSALMCKIHPSIAEVLTDAVRARGMARFVTHEVLGKGVLNTAWTSGFGASEAWSEQLRNKDDLVLATHLQKPNFLVVVLVPSKKMGVKSLFFF